MDGWEELKYVWKQIPQVLDVHLKRDRNFTGPRTFSDVPTSLKPVIPSSFPLGADWSSRGAQVKRKTTNNIIWNSNGVYKDLKYTQSVRYVEGILQAAHCRIPREDKSSLHGKLGKNGRIQQSSSCVGSSAGECSNGHDGNKTQGLCASNRNANW